MLPAGGPPPDPHAPGPFAFADAERVRGILEQAGWRHVELAPHDIRYITGVGSDPVADALALFARIGPAARAMRELPESERPAFQARLAEFVAEHRRGDAVAFAAATWIVTATKA